MTAKTGKIIFRLHPGKDSGTLSQLLKVARRGPGLTCQKVLQNNSPSERRVDCRLLFSNGAENMKTTLKLFLVLLMLAGCGPAYEPIDGSSQLETNFHALKHTGTLHSFQANDQIPLYAGAGNP